MNLVNALLNNVDNISALKDLVKTEGIAVAGESYKTTKNPATTTLKKKLESASEEELELICDTLNISPGDVSEESNTTTTSSRELDLVPDSFLEGESTGEFKTKKGDVVPIVFAAYSHKNSFRNKVTGRMQSNRIFKLKNGTSVVIPNMDYVADSIESKLIQRGEFTFPINRSTIGFLPYENTVEAMPLASHAIFQEANAIKEDKQEKMENWERSLRTSGMSDDDIRDIKKQKALESMPDIF